MKDRLLTIFVYSAREAITGLVVLMLFLALVFAAFAGVHLPLSSRIVIWIAAGLCALDVPLAVWQWRLRRRGHTIHVTLKGESDSLRDAITRMEATLDQLRRGRR